MTRGPTCPLCGHRLRQRGNFCANCGQPLAEADRQDASLSAGRPVRFGSGWLIGGTLLLLITAGLLWGNRWLGQRTLPASPPAGAAATNEALAATPTLAPAAIVLATMTRPPVITPSLSSSPEATRPVVTGTPAPSDTPPPTATMPPTPSPGWSPTPASSATPNPTPTWRPTPCAVAVLPIFQADWEAHAVQLGCPWAVGRRSVDMTGENFQQGRMLWRSDSRQIYVFYDGGHWQLFDDAWHTGLDAFSCGQPQSPPTPQRGFGLVWCQQASVRQGLGDAVDAEWAVPAAIQEFAGGLIIQLNRSGGPTYILYQDGSWRS